MTWIVTTSVRSRPTPAFSHAIKAAVSRLTPYSASVGAFYQQLTGALPLTPAHLQLIGSSVEVITNHKSQLVNL